MTLLLDRCLKRSFLLQELLERWQLDHRESLFASDVEELCSECRELCELCKRAWVVLWNELFQLHVNNTEISGRTLQAAVGRSLELANSIHELMREAEKKGIQLSGATDFAERVKELEVMKQDIAEKWPFFDPKESEESHAAFLRGEYITAEELLHAVQSSRLQAIE